MSDPPISRDRVRLAAEEEKPWEFLASIEPDLRAFEADIDRMRAMWGRASDPFEQFSSIGIAADWFRLREHDHRRMQERGAEALRRLARLRAVIKARTSRRRFARRVHSQDLALLSRLDLARAMIEDFITAIPRALDWIRNDLLLALPELGGGLGSSRIDVLSNSEIALVCLVSPAMI